MQRALREAAYVAVGFAVIGVQRAQVRRRELARQLPEIEQHLPAGVREILDTLRASLSEQRSAQPG